MSINLAYVSAVAQLQMGASHGMCVRPLLSLRTFAPYQAEPRDEPQGRSWHRFGTSAAHRKWTIAASAGGDTDSKFVREMTRFGPDPGGSDDLLAPDPPYGAPGGGGWAGYSSGAGPGPGSRVQDAYNELLAGSDLLNSDSYGRDGGDMYADPEAFYERLEQLPPELQRQELQRLQDQEVREEWEIEQAQNKAMELHHSQMEKASSRYEMALRMGDIMEELERHDYYAGDGQDLVPSWVRAHFILEQELAQQRAGEDPASIQIAAAKQRSGGDTLDRPLDEILPGAETQETIEAYLEDIIGAKPPEQATYAAADYADEDVADAKEEEDYNNAFESSTADADPLLQALGPMPQSDLEGAVPVDDDTQPADLEGFE